MLQQLHAARICGIDPLSRRMDRIGLDPYKLKPDQIEILGEIRARCPTCDDPARCAGDLAAAVPECGWEDWDDYCPNSARLRILAALTMFSDDATATGDSLCLVADPLGKTFAALKGANA
jgi:hypothetical protein